MPPKHTASGCGWHNHAPYPTASFVEKTVRLHFVSVRSASEPKSTPLGLKSGCSMEVLTAVPWWAVREKEALPSFGARAADKEVKQWRKRNKRNLAARSGASSQVSMSHGPGGMMELLLRLAKG